MAKTDNLGERFGKISRAILLGGVSTLTMGALAMPAHAQEAGEDEIVVTGIRGSLLRAMDVKRNSDGVVDAISAEDIGKFPDMNLAESLQRITGVSIDRVNGEGATVTARGFGPGFNLVTLNGRQMPVADVNFIGAGGDAEYGTFTSRSFDFSNLASEGVSGINVYKTGQADVPSGGIGATIDVHTFRPLDNPGVRATVGVKALADQSVETGDEITPEATGLFSWTDSSEMIGVSLFGSYQRRDSAAVGASNQGWNAERGSVFMSSRIRPDNPNTPANEAASVTNPPTADQLVVFPNNSDYFFSEHSRERINGLLTVQFRPADTLTLTADAFYAANESEEQRSTQGNWFNRPFDQVVFDGDPLVATAVFLQETLSAPKDIAWAQEFRAQRDEVTSFGVNAEWLLSDRLSLTFDVHTASAESAPNGANGISSYAVGTGAAAIAAHSLDFSSGFPVQRFIYDDSNLGNGNSNNGLIDIEDVSSSVGRTAAQYQSQDIQEFRADLDFALSDSIDLRAGIHHISSTMNQQRVVTAQILGDWGVTQPGDIEANAPGALEAYCLACLFDDYEPGDAEIAFRGNAADIYSVISPYYLGLGGHDIQTWNNDNNVVEEDITAFYASAAWNGEIGGHEAALLVGVRHEETEVYSATQQAVPTNVVWFADNDMAFSFGGGSQSVSSEAEYSHTLPSVDFRINLLENVVARASYSTTIARANFGDLFASQNPGTSRATALGGNPGGNAGNPALVPLESDNIDLSLEVYFDDASYVSVGIFDKRVANFVGTGVVNRNMFDLRDPSTGAPGTRSRAAIDALATIPGAILNDVHLFVMTALIDNRPTVADAVAEFQANSTNGVLNQTYADQIMAQYDILPDASDPLYDFAVAQPINQQEANIHGVEFAIQHFFGDSGFGFQANYTMVDGDVAINVASDPNANQFALVGLSDTANVTLIYENFGLSARLAYNWRDEFLSQVNRGDARNPTFVDAFESYDVAVSYDVTESLAVSFEGVNVLGENYRTFARAPVQYWLVQELDPRFLIGARYRFN